MTRSSRHRLGTRAVVDRRVPESVALVVAVAAIWWTLRMLHQRACNTGDDQLNTMLRLCYSDLPVIWRSGLGDGATPYQGMVLDQPPVIGAIVMLTQRLTLLAQPAGGAAAEVLFVWLNVWLLGAAFLLLVGCHLWISRQLPSAHAAGNLALLTASCLGVLTAGTISWTLVPVTLVALALVLWARGRPSWAGVLLGAAASAAWYPLLVLVAWLLLARRADRMRDAITATVATGAAWLVFNLPLLLLAPQGWLTQAKAALAAPIGLGSVWFLLQQLTGQSPAVWVISAAVMLIAIGAVAALVWGAPRRPRVAQIAALLVLAAVLTAPVYSPQHVLWIAPLVLLARPVLLDWAIFCVVEALYWAAVWGHLQGNLGTGTPLDLYATAVVLRVAVELLMLVKIGRDVLQPWHDPLRRGHVDDPLGGVLDHAPDRARVSRTDADRDKPEPFSLTEVVE